MLGMTGQPVAITVEGVPAKEGASLAAGLDAIDVGEYYGAQEIEKAERVRYLQLKHSTRDTHKPWTLSGVKRTLGNFGKRYGSLVDRFGAKDVARRFTFEFLSNRPIAASLSRALKLLEEGSTDPAAAGLAKAIGLTGARKTGFAGLLTLTGNVSDYLGQRNLLEREAFAYLPERDRDAPLRLKEMVTRRATSEYEGRPEITRLHVLEALNASERDLFPAPNLIDTPSSTVDREQMRGIVGAISSAKAPVILRADGGVGKSVLTTRLGALFPVGSETFVYDSFGNGGYRSATEYRHRPRDGLVQLANEMAARQLSDPLVPSATADVGSYLRAFKARLEQASAVLAARDQHALLTLVIDAADNAEMAAAEAHDGHSFAFLLLREKLPHNVRLLLTARPHRVSLLEPPAEVFEIDLASFTAAETTALLRAAYPQASKHDASEFHRLTSQNPRVQAAALAAADTLTGVLQRLGSAPLTVDGTIARLLEAAIARLRFDAGAVEREHIDRVFTALATLRPFVPLRIVAATADVSVALVRSIANDLAHPLLIREDAVQFRDEPTETWFRDHFRPPPAQLGAFIDRLRPLAAGSAYVAASLPSLMLGAGQLDALIALALADAGLPEDDALARRDVQLQRLQFAIKAAIRAGRNADAAALAMKAGREAAADTRQQRMLSAHTDLGGHFFAPEQMLEQVSRRLIRGGNWTGSEHAYEAAFLSTVPELHGDARSLLRIAFDWLNHWARAGQQAREGKRVEQADVAELAMAVLNLRGPAACAVDLRRWHRREVSFAAGRILTARLVDAARFEELDALAFAAGNDIGLILALCQELGEVGRTPPRSVVRRALRIATRQGVKLRSCGDWRAEQTLLEAVLALVEAALVHRACGRPALARFLERYLPASPPELSRHDYGGTRDDRHTYLRGFSLRSALRGRPLGVDAYLALRKEPGKRGGKQPRRTYDGDSYEARQLLGALLPWHNLRARTLLTRAPVADVEFAECLSGWRSNHYPGSRERSRTADEIARVWCSILDDARYDQSAWQQLLEWRAILNVPLFIPTEVALARRAARRGELGSFALGFAGDAFSQIGGPDEDAESQIDSCVSIARAVLPLSIDEARAYFDRAVLLSSRVGEENVPSWEAMLDLGATATRDPIDLPQTAYRFARAAELTYAHCVRDKHFDWERSVTTLAGLSPRLAPAQFSRWLDRGFGSESRYLPTLAGFQLERGDLSPTVAVALESFEGDWDRADLLKCVFEHEAGPARDAAAALIVRHARLDRAAAPTWRRLISALEAHGLDTHEAQAGLCVALRDEAAREPGARARQTHGRKKVQRSGSGYSQLFRGLDPTRSADLAVAEQRLTAGRPPFEWRDFYKTAMALVPVGSEARFLDSMSEGASPRLLGLRDLFDALPLEWLARASVPPALARLVRKLVRAESRRVYLGVHYDYLPWAELKTVCGLGKQDIAREAVAAIGEQSDPLGSDDLFRLVNLLAALMTPVEAKATMSRALDLYEPLFEAGSGDGPWSEDLSPSPATDQVWAGYIWAALGAPSASRRWEAAHAVRSLARLGQAEMLAGLVAFARSGKAGPFADAGLRFYALHARLWLVIAFARAAAESPEAITPHADWLNTIAAADNPHLLLRAFAARTLLSLHHAGMPSLGTARVRQLEGMTAGQVAPRPSATGTPNGPAADSGERFAIDHDVQRHEIPALSAALGVSDQVVAETIQAVIHDDWRLADRGRWDEDARATRKIYPETGYAGGSETRFDDLNRYLSFHARYIAAGKLLGIRAATPGFDAEAFAGWFRDEGLTHPDGTWRADRRDALPTDLTVLPDGDDKSWPASPDDDDAETHMFLEPDWATVSARFSRFSGQRRERVTIASALVSADHGRALARTYRIHVNPWGADIPNFGDPAIDRQAFRFEGWILREHHDQGLDRHDPWAAELGTSRFSPAAPYRAMLGITEKDGRRLWIDADGRPVMTTTQWSDGIDGDMIRYGGGIRTILHQSMLDALVNATGMSLLIHVRIERDLVELRHSTFKDKGVADARTVTQIYIYEAGTGWWQPGSAPPARRRARKRARSG